MCDAGGRRPASRRRGPSAARLRLIRHRPDVAQERAQARRSRPIAAAAARRHRRRRRRPCRPQTAPPPQPQRLLRNPAARRRPNNAATVTTPPTTPTNPPPRTTPPRSAEDRWPPARMTQNLLGSTLASSAAARRRLPHGLPHIPRSPLHERSKPAAMASMARGTAARRPPVAWAHRGASSPAVSHPPSPRHRPNGPRRFRRRPSTHRRHLQRRPLGLRPPAPSTRRV
mmetsp:Transcript_33767/g.92600  ORF Transcript_33767/g.92600 Transcript_33767/m.92600 type:complete len:228 (-) Transcript_33767:509-1192(-)